MKASPLPRKTARISDSLHRQLNMYALAAGAAGVGTLCFTMPAEGRIVYTPAHVSIKANGGWFRIDLNHDGSPDFALRNRSSPSNYFRDLLARESQSPNEILMTNTECAGSPGSGAAALPKGKRIGPNGEFKHSRYAYAGMAYVGKATSCGPWARQSNLQAYLGLKFTINGKIHFGWARLEVDTQRQEIPFSVTLTGYAYETIPGKAIIAGATKGPDDAESAASVPMHAPPQAATLGTLALGSPGLSIWRREEPAARTQQSN